MLLDRVPKLGPKRSDGIELAVRWYGMSVGSSDPLDGYLAAWIGLESVGPTLNHLYHTAGPKAPCTTCGNVAGEDRDRKIAGIEHMIRVTADELLDHRTMEDLENLRHDIVHALRPADKLRPISENLLPNVQLVLGVGILTALKPAPTSDVGWSAMLPRDYEVRPDARATLYSSVELVDHQSYSDGWIRAERTITEERSRCEPDGNYVWGGGVRVRWKVTLPTEAAQPKQQYVQFERSGRKLEVVRPAFGHSKLPQVEEAPWRDRSIPQAWERYRKMASESGAAGRAPTP